MKVLLISAKSKRNPGGIAIWTNGFLKGCSSNGIEVDVVNTEVSGQRLENATSGRNIFDEIKRTKRILQDLKKCLKNLHDYDVVHLNTSCGTYGIIRDWIAARYVKRKKLPLITHYHCDIPYWMRKFFSNFMLKRLAKLSDKNIVLCENSKKYLENVVGVSSIFVPNFVDEKLVITRPKTINEELKRIVFVGRVSRAKGAFELYELAKRLPYITFELIGEISGEFSNIDQPDNVVTTGPMKHDALINHLDMADVFLFPSHTEGFSLALAEAMARGLPCIATDVGANADMLSDRCGCVVSVGDIDSMENAIRELASSETRRQVSENIVEKVKNNYIVDSVVREVNKLYLSVQ